MDLKRLFPILLIIFTNILGAGVIIPILPLYAQGTFQGSVIQITLLSSAFFGAQFLAAPVLGRLSDRYGRRPLLIISQLGTVVAFMLFIFAIPLGQKIDALNFALPVSGGMLILFAGRILDGITGGNITIAQAYISDITPEDHRAHGLGLLQGAIGAGFIFGPAFGGILSNYGQVMPFIGATVITAITLLLTLFTLKESLTEEERSDNRHGNGVQRIPWKNILALLLVLVIGFIGSLAFSSMPSTFSLFADHVIFTNPQFPERVKFYIGLMFAFNGSMQVLTQLVLIRPLVGRFGERTLLLIGQAAIALAFLGLASSSNAIIATFLFAPYAFGFGVSEPSMQSLVTRFGQRQARGYLLGLYQSARSLALIVGPILAGYVYQNISPRSVFDLAAVVIGVAFVAGLALKRMEIVPITAEANPS
ncbi:MAG: MFS transporter [Chloroflexi bacterium]|nr:MFS transporter [Chloroflexota bacterium]